MTLSEMKTILYGINASLDIMSENNIECEGTAVKLIQKNKKARGKKKNLRGFPGGPVVGSLPSSTGDAGLISGGKTKKPQAMGPLSLCIATPELRPQLVRLHATVKTQNSQKKNIN